MTFLIAADIGNVNLKYRNHARTWVLEPSLVRTVPAAGYTIGSERMPTSLRYLAGPAHLPPDPVYVGSDAERHGTHDLALIGSAEARVRSAAYLYLHLYAMVMSLPTGITHAEIDFAGGLPVMDAGNPAVGEHLRTRLRGLHSLLLGETCYTVVVKRVLLVPQPVGAIATTMFHPDGKVRTNGALLATRYVLDVGGGTTDYTGRTGLHLIPGTEGGVRLGVMDAARHAREHIQARYPMLRNLSDATVLAALRSGTGQIAYQGEPLDVQCDLATGLRLTAHSILADVLPKWERGLEAGEVLICGGGGQVMADTLAGELRALTKVTLLSDPVFRVVDGIERLARNKL